jgi:hypothetical protein
MHHSRTDRAGTSAIRRGLAVGLALSVVAACSGSSSTAVETSGNEQVVPVLWAGRAASGDMVGGVEPAIVDVRTDTEARFEVLLDSLEARGAGSVWKATSSLAAMLATLNAGVDPRLVDVDFEITGPIDGPSGGAILTIGTLAAMRGDELRTGVTMTGTIAPDGTIGMVGEIPTKIESAADAGYRTVLVPAGAVATFGGPVGRSGAADLVELGRSLGVDVVEVGHLDEAYRMFTGSTIAPAGGPSNLLDPTVQSTVEAVTAALVTTCRDAVESLPTGMDAARVDRLESLVDRLDESSGTDPVATTYGLGIDVLQNIRREVGRHRSAEIVRLQGAQAAWQQLRDEVDTLSAANLAAFRAYTDVDGLGVERILSLPFALGWFTYEIGVLGAIGAALDGPVDLSQLDTIAAAVAQSETAISTFGPDAVAIVRASSDTPIDESVDLAGFIEGYVDFIDRAATTTAEYARVDGLFARSTDPISALGALQRHPSMVEPGDSPLRAAVTNLAVSASEFVLAETIVSGASFGLAGFGIGEDPTAFGGANALLALSVRSGVEQARALGSSLVENGSGLDYVLWQADLAEGVLDAFDDDARFAAAGVIALDEVWYAVINAQMVSASRNAVRFS